MSGSSRPAVPPDTLWVEPLRRFREHFKELSTVVHLFRAGCSDVQLSAELFDLLEDEDDNESRRMEKRELAELARKQQERGFPMLYEHSLISLWGALEVLVEDIAVAWLVGHPELLQAPPVSEVKLTVGEYQSLSEDERLRHIVFELQRSKKADLQRGVGQFSALLNAVGLGWGPTDKVRDALYYHHQFRNLIAHRGAVADRRFVEVCPKLGYTAGERVVISDDTFAYLLYAAALYAFDLRNHCADLDGYAIHPRPESSSDRHTFDWTAIRSEAVTTS